MSQIEPKVSVVCMTYNHVRFIRQALDGFVMQKTNFPFEVIIHDDASTDGTADIIREYAKKYPDIIKPILQTENQWSRGVGIASNFIWPKIRGQYVAKCDGDDYWTDENKLQKQADFLDQHPDYSICHCAVTIFWDDNSRPEVVWPKCKKDRTLDDLLYQCDIANCTVMYRWVDPAKSWPATTLYPGDWFMHILHAQHGKVRFFPEVVARYRRHPRGISFSGVDINNGNPLHMQWGIHEMRFFREVEQRFAPDKAAYHTFVCERAREIINAYALGNRFDNAIKVLQMCPDALVVRMTPPVKKWRKRFNRLLAASITIIITLTITVGVLL